MSTEHVDVGVCKGGESAGIVCWGVTGAGTVPPPAGRKKLARNEPRGDGACGEGTDGIGTGAGGVLTGGT